MGVDCAQKIPEATEQSERLVGTVEKCSKIVIELETRLKGILRQEPPTCGEDKLKTETTLVPFAEKIRREVSKIDTIGIALNSIINRIEL